MRIIAGKYRGFRLFTPKTSAIRPTTDRVKEVVFAYLGDRVSNKHVLDLFSGSANLAIEAMSRGAASISCVDSSPVAIALIKKNLFKTSANADVFKIKAEDFIRLAGRKNLSYDLIFCDPPYQYDRQQQLFSLLIEKNVLREDGILVYEYGSRLKCEYNSDVFCLLKQKNFGDTQIAILQRKKDG